MKETIVWVVLSIGVLTFFYFLIFIYNQIKGHQ